MILYEPENGVVEVFTKDVELFCGPVSLFVKRQVGPVDPGIDLDELYSNSHGSITNERISTYMAYG